MNELTTILEQGQQFFVQHAPADVLKQAIPAGLILLVGGILLSVLGAKLARFGLTAAAVILGGSAGVAFAKANGFQPIICLMCGAFLVGLAGYLTFRLWVGIGTALVVTFIALGAFGHYELRPYLAEFEGNTGRVSSPGAAFTIPSADAQKAFLDRGPQQWGQEFWQYLGERDANAVRYTKAVMVVALLTGLCVGLMATRWALVLSTSLVGTFFVAVGAATVLVRSVPQSVAALEKNPGLAAAGLAGFLLTSLVLQTLLSRKTADESE